MEKSSPISYRKVYFGWTIISILTAGLLPPLLDAFNPGGEQLGMTLLAYSIPASALGYGAISAYMLLFRGKQGTYYTIVNSFVLALVLGTFLWYFLSELSIADREIYIVREGRDEIKVQRDYYRPNHRLKSVKYWRNAEEDSVWLDYNRSGNVIRKIKY